MTLCNMAIEAGARVGLVGVDDKTIDYLRGRPQAPQGTQWESAVAAWRTLVSDEGAAFDRELTIDASTLEQARALCEEATQLFGVSMGRMHQKPVGPHPDWSCQLAFGPELVGVVLPWLALYRKGLVVFLHPLTGDELVDHRDHAIWMGAVRPLDLSIFE